MARKVEQRILKISKGYRSAEAASFVAQLDDLTRRTFEDFKGVSSAELAWQPKRGQNTMGMLFAHLAIVEAYWLHFARNSDYDLKELQRVLGIGPDDDGLPLPANGLPPAKLRGWTLARYRTLLKRSRAYVTKLAKSFTPADLDRSILRVRKDGTRVQIQARWILYHVVEHYSGHYGQLLLMHHQYRDRRKK